jgi:hypothetical protein
MPEPSYFNQLNRIPKEMSCELKAILLTLLMNAESKRDIATC